MCSFSSPMPALLLCAILLTGCPVDPAYVKDPDPIKPGTQCEDAQRTLDTMNCSIKEHVKKDGTKESWGQKCHFLANTGYPRILIVGKCVETAKTCEEAGACS